MNIGNCHALNYTSACVDDLTKLAAALDAASMPHSSIAVRSVLSTMREAQHFVLPDGGRILDDNLRGLRGNRIRLPFPSVTLEYFVGQSHDPNGEPSSRRIVIATEQTYDEIDALMASMATPQYWPRREDDERLIIVAAASFYDIDNSWRVQASAIVIGESWEALENSRKVPDFFPRKRQLTGSEAAFECFPICLLPEVAKIIIDDMGDDAAFRAMMHDINDEVTALMEFCEALTCANVKPTQIQSVSPAVNARKAAAGKLPLADAWCLTVDVPNETNSGRHQDGGTHRSPRTHLRRGHIRRLPDKNVWVNSTVVGAGSVQIKKTYRLAT